MVGVKRIAALATFAPLVHSTPCSQLDKYVLWIEEFMEECAEHPAVSAQDGGWFDTCSWVECKCLWHALKVPVPNEEISICFEHGLRLERVQTAHQQFILAMMNTCAARTTELSAPCGECDAYRSQRAECDHLNYDPPALPSGDPSLPSVPVPNPNEDGGDGSNAVSVGVSVGVGLTVAAFFV